MTEKQISTLNILKLIKEAQQKHGLRQGNYLRYRSYCTQRIRRIRKALKFTNIHKCVGKRTAKFQQRIITPDIVTEARYLELLIFNTERHWAYAMQLKLEIDGEILSRKKFHMRQKLRRAVKSVIIMEQLTKQCENLDTATKLETQAYNAFIRATRFLEFKQWRKALDLYSTVKKIYEKLNAVVKNPELMELYAARCREVQNTIRLCEYNCVENATAGVASIAVGVEDLELDLDFNKLYSEIDKETEDAQPKVDEINTKILIEQLRKDWRSVDPAKLKNMTPIPALLENLPNMQPMPCKPMFFDISSNYLKKALTQEQIEGKNKKK